MLNPTQIRQSLYAGTNVTPLFDPDGTAPGDPPRIIDASFDITGATCIHFLPDAAEVNRQMVSQAEAVIIETGIMKRAIGRFASPRRVIVAPAGLPLQPVERDGSADLTVGVLNDEDHSFNNGWPPARAIINQVASEFNMVAYGEPLSVGHWGKRNRWITTGPAIEGITDFDQFVKAVDVLLLTGTKLPTPANSPALPLSVMATGVVVLSMENPSYQQALGNCGSVYFPRKPQEWLQILDDLNSDRSRLKAEQREAAIFARCVTERSKALRNRD